MQVHNLSHQVGDFYNTLNNPNMDASQKGAEAVRAYVADNRGAKAEIDQTFNDIELIMEQFKSLDFDVSAPGNLLLPTNNAIRSTQNPDRIHRGPTQPDRMVAQSHLTAVKATLQADQEKLKISQ